MKFKTTILQVGNNTGIEVPEEIILKFGAGKKPPVVVTLKGYTYRSTVAVMGGKYLIPLSAEHRNNSTAKGGENLEVNLELDTAPRIVNVPEDLAAKLKVNNEANSFYESLAPSSKKKIVTLIEAAKTEATRNKRIDKTVADLEQKKKP